MYENITLNLSKKEIEAILEGLLTTASSAADKAEQYKKDATEASFNDRNTRAEILTSRANKAQIRCDAAYSAYDKIKQFII